jgi:hypothetical protein
LRSREVPIPGIILEAKENKMAQILDKIDLKASNEWLEHFKNQTQHFKESVMKKRRMRMEEQ